MKQLGANNRQRVTNTLQQQVCKTCNLPKANLMQKCNTLQWCRPDGEGNKNDLSTTSTQIAHKIHRFAIKDIRTFNI